MKMPVLFADKLLGAMMDDGYISASELARRVFGTTTDSRGYTVARGRDRIGHYLRGTSYPNPANLLKIADALGVPIGELTSATAPPRRAAPAGPKQAPITITGHFTMTLYSSASELMDTKSGHQMTIKGEKK